MTVIGNTEWKKQLKDRKENKEETTINMTERQKN